MQKLKGLGQLAWDIAAALALGAAAVALIALTNTTDVDLEEVHPDLADLDRWLEQYYGTEEAPG